MFSYLDPQEVFTYERIPRNKSWAERWATSQGSTRILTNPSRIYTSSKHIKHKLTKFNNFPTIHYRGSGGGCPAGSSKFACMRGVISIDEEERAAALAT